MAISLNISNKAHERLARVYELKRKNINPKSINDCYVLNRPRISKANSFGKELNDYRLSSNRDKSLIKFISRKKK